MELRWYQTYDKHGVDSTETLQYKDPDLQVEGEDDIWIDVEFVREREPYKEE